LAITKRTVCGLSLKAKLSISNGKKPIAWAFFLCIGVDFARVRGQKVDRGVERQLATIRTLCHRPDVDTIVNVGKADVFADKVDIFAESSGELLTKGVGLL
jgi:hypothetical protein